eukprot:scaffold57122_cov17-Tisochrysis_lutea.AAC.1
MAVAAGEVGTPAAKAERAAGGASGDAAPGSVSLASGVGRVAGSRVLLPPLPLSAEAEGCGLLCAGWSGARELRAGGATGSDSGSPRCCDSASGGGGGGGVGSGMVGCVCTGRDVRDEVGMEMEYRALSSAGTMGGGAGRTHDPAVVLSVCSPPPASCCCGCQASGARGMRGMDAKVKGATSV